MKLQIQARAAASVRKTDVVVLQAHEIGTVCGGLSPLGLLGAVAKGGALYPSYGSSYDRDLDDLQVER